MPNVKKIGKLLIKRGNLALLLNQSYVSCLFRVFDILFPLGNHYFFFFSIKYCKQLWVVFKDYLFTIT